MSSFSHSLNRFAVRAFALAGASLLATSLTAEPVQQQNSNAVWFENWTGLSNARMIVIAPDGEIATIEAKSGTPVYTLPQRDVQDGIHRYELTAATDETERVVNAMANGRDSTPTHQPKSFMMNGYFEVERGVIIIPAAPAEE